MLLYHRLIGKQIKEKCSLAGTRYQIKEKARWICHFQIFLPVLLDLCFWFACIAFFFFAYDGCLVRAWLGLGEN